MSFEVDGRRIRRVLIYGVTGSGKTTLAERLAGISGLPWHSVDDLTWEPGWIAVPEDEQRRRISTICDGDEWLLDTAYGLWRDIPLARVELIVALDYPRMLSLWRLVRRSVMRAIDKKPICNGNIETWRTMFSKSSIIAWHFKSFGSKKKRIAGWSDKPEGRIVVRIRKPRDLEEWLARIDDRRP